jgi:hypothetical protein
MAKIAKESPPLADAPKSTADAPKSTAAPLADAPAEDGWSMSDVLVGRSAYFVSEKIAPLFGKSVKIIAIQGHRAKISPDHLPHTVEVDIADLDMLPRLLENPQIRKGPLSKADLEEAKLRFGDEVTKLAMGDCLTDRHMMIGHWIIQRDLPGAKGHYLVSPQIVWTIRQSSLEDHAEAAEMRAKAEGIVKQRFKRSVLLGLPICQGGHWTLLCFRRSAVGVQIKYYDSLPKAQAACLQVAQQIVELLSPGTLLEDRSNASVQSNGVDCGVYALHYWDMEIRRVEGYGWQGGWPQNGKEIKSRKTRLINMIEQIRAYVAAPPAEPPKKKKGDRCSSAAIYCRR